MTKYWAGWEASSAHPVKAGCPFNTYLRAPSASATFVYAELMADSTDSAKTQSREYWPEANWPGPHRTSFVSQYPDGTNPKDGNPALYANDFAGTPRE